MLFAYLLSSVHAETHRPSVVLGVLSFPKVTCLWKTKAQMVWRL